MGLSPGGRRVGLLHPGAGARLDAQPNGGDNDRHRLLTITIPLSPTGNVVPELHAWILPAALVLDLVPWARITRRRLRQAAMAAGYSAAFSLAVLFDLARPAIRIRLT